MYYPPDINLLNVAFRSAWGFYFRHELRIFLSSLGKDMLWSGFEPGHGHTVCFVLAGRQPSV